MHISRYLLISLEKPASGESATGGLFMGLALLDGADGGACEDKRRQKMWGELRDEDADCAGCGCRINVEDQCPGLTQDYVLVHLAIDRSFITGRPADPCLHAYDPVRPHVNYV